MLHFMGSQRVGHDLVTEQQQQHAFAILSSELLKTPMYFDDVLYLFRETSYACFVDLLLRI